MINIFIYFFCELLKKLSYNCYFYYYYDYEIVIKNNLRALLDYLYKLYPANELFISNLFVKIIMINK
jgi:hypothetical protein